MVMPRKTAVTKELSSEILHCYVRVWSYTKGRMWIEGVQEQVNEENIWT
jgi:hypothetical protein